MAGKLHPALLASPGWREERLCPFVWSWVLAAPQRCCGRSLARVPFFKRACGGVCAPTAEARGEALGRLGKVGLRS